MTPAEARLFLDAAVHAEQLRCLDDPERVRAMRDALVALVVDIGIPLEWVDEAIEEWLAALRAGAGR